MTKETQPANFQRLDGKQRGCVRRQSVDCETTWPTQGSQLGRVCLPPALFAAVFQNYGLNNRVCPVGPEEEVKRRTEEELRSPAACGRGSPASFAFGTDVSPLLRYLASARTLATSLTTLPSVQEKKEAKKGRAG